mmetsp:Transcript_3454/g.5815  ORF Transcript_3454/g.5815 Transcript_3454/m.5815 type:complete len:340 (-) Transcript_3454:100-1119(-)|eukprot:CAMPEP_0197055960 /NCGR_PEP_ID=MMETSP1384-20130603/76323_1 /TAXON_ID=29189 /ORGANISM="Ammonia sp." /LENGTH=339 /DNA_ID=CAMNT_0042489737 /DNA_START=13 /DNA_END=1032 /DNA_ORIENTATION=-
MAAETTRVRPAKKAGSWYTKEASKLSEEFETWLKNSKKTIENKAVKAIICPHAGYMYCGGTAAYSYRHVDPSKVKRVFILGPDHCGATHSGKHRCMLSNATHWATPFGEIEVDTDIVSQLHQTQCFDLLSMKQDASEHSMELIVPFLSFMFVSHYGAQPQQEQKSEQSQKQQTEWNATFKIIPIMVGSCKRSQHELYGRILSKYFGDESTLFVISSDFCHWGYNYGYTPFDKQNYKNGHIHEYIKDLDFMGIEYLEKLDYHGFHQYLDNTKNTICGQHPICVLLNTINAYNASKHSKQNSKFQMRFINYSQSGKVTSFNDYSVSYASGILYQIDSAPKK